MKNRRKTGVLLVAMIAATFTFAAFTQSASALSHQVKSQLSGLCLEPSPDENGAYIENGLLVFQQVCTNLENNSGNPQFWHLIPRGTAPVRGRSGTWNVYLLQNKVSLGCLDNRDGSLADGAPVQLWSCNDSRTMKWTISRSGPDGSQEFVNSHSGKCLDVHGGFTHAGVAIEQYTCAPVPFAGNLWFL